MWSVSVIDPHWMKDVVTLTEDGAGGRTVVKLGLLEELKLQVWSSVIVFQTEETKAKEAEDSVKSCMFYQCNMQHNNQSRIVLIG